VLFDQRVEIVVNPAQLFDALEDVRHVGRGFGVAT
jgi:hypothetical protein